MCGSHSDRCTLIWGGRGGYETILGGLKRFSHAERGRGGGGHALSFFFMQVLSPYFTANWVTNTNEMNPNNMTSTWPIRWGFALWACVGGNANFSVYIWGNANFNVFRYQHVGIPNPKLLRWG